MDEHTGWQAAADGRSGGPSRTTVMVGGAVAFVLLATTGAVAGWQLAGDPTTGPVAAGAVPTVATSSAHPTRSARPTRSSGPTSSRPTATTAAPVGQTMPNLVGMSFEEARSELRRLRLGWRLEFGGAGDDRSVRATYPSAGQPVRRGTTVRVVVVGAAPPVEVPDLAGLSCSAAADRLVEAGLYPAYPDGRVGPVAGQDPQPGSTVRWNDRVRISCGASPSTEPSASPTP